MKDVLDEWNTRLLKYSQSQNAPSLKRKAKDRYQLAATLFVQVDPSSQNNAQVQYSTIQFVYHVTDCFTDLSNRVTIYPICSSFASPLQLYARLRCCNREILYI